MIDAIILAAGMGKRMNSNINKQFLDINGVPILIHTIEKFYKNRNIDRMFLVIRKEEEPVIENLLHKFNLKNINIVYGGKERQNSVYNAIMYIDKSQIVLIHDGARPFINNKIINNSIEYTKKYHCTCVGVPVKDTIKILDEDNNIVKTPNRNILWAAQTPQSFKFDIIRDAHIYAIKNNIIATDDASLVELMGNKVKMIDGSYDNIKITTPEDLKYAELIFKNI